MRAARAASGTRFVFDRSLRELAYRCHPDGCHRDRTCCVGLAVEVTRSEIRVIDGLMDELAGVLPSLRDDEGYVDAFVEDPPQWLFETEDDGACPFLQRTPTHSLCSIHGLALAHREPVANWKPASCRHWPITLRAEGARVRVLVHPAALSIGCVAPVAELPGQPTVLEAYREELIEICGLEEVERRVPAARKPG